MSEPSGGELTLSERLAERVAGARAGRAILSVALLAIVLATIAWNLPPGEGPGSATESSALRQDLLAGGAPLLYSLGLDQNWDVFAPPRTQVIKMRAKLTYADGSVSVWRPPVSLGALVGAYRDYRWGKLIESEIADANSGLWVPFAMWIARNESVPGRKLVSVKLIRRFYNIKPIAGGSSGRGPWKEVTYFVYEPKSAAGQSR